MVSEWSLSIGGNVVEISTVIQISCEKHEGVGDPFLRQMINLENCRHHVMKEGCKVYED